MNYFKAILFFLILVGIAQNMFTSKAFATDSPAHLEKASFAAG